MTSNNTHADRAWAFRLAVIVGTVVLAVAVLSGCNRAGRGDSDAEAEEISYAVGVAPVGRGEVVDYIEVSGDVETVSSVDVFPDTAGTLKSVTIRVGEQVVLDQVLAEVDPSRPGQRFTPSPVRSPIAGTVVSLPARVGATVSMGTSIARIATTRELQIRTTVPERFIARVRPGQTAAVRLSAYPDEWFPAQVTELSPVLDPQARTLETILRFNQPDPRPKAGMFARIRLELERKPDVILVPAGSVVRRGGDTFVFVLDERNDETRVVQRDIRTGIQTGGYLEVMGGVSENEYLVVQGQNLVEDGALVRVVSGREE
jgi:membrane fusion protein, multidrug efflux system